MAPVSLRVYLVAALVAALVVPATATAAKPVHYLAPPGNSAVSQYLEVVPTASGSAPAPGSGPAGGTPAATPTSSLDHYGSTGKILAGVVAATAPEAASAPPTRAGRRHTAAPVASSGSGRGPGTGAGAGPDVVPSSGAGSPVSAVLAAGTGRVDGGGLGVGLPIVMIAALVVVVFVAVRRRGVRDS
jgi:hypothetical protein